ncbi:MAG TPA: ABC transporter permease [Pararobbsia sp.]|nr:ABC transporter permease [Pararobbsia sp.]
MNSTPLPGFRLDTYVKQARGVVPLIVLILLVAGSSFYAPGMLSIGGLSNFSTDAAPLLILVVGSTLPILAGSIDLSVAGIAALVGVLVVDLHPIFGAWATPVVLCGVCLFGALQGYVHAKLQLPSFITTLATLSILTGLGLLLSNATALPIPDDDALFIWLSGNTRSIPNSIIVVLGITILLAIVLRYTRLGRDLYAIGSGERTAIMSGVNTIRVRCIVFALSAFCAGIGGVLLSSITGFSSPTIAGNLLLLSIVGVVLGGTAISGGVGGLGAALVGGAITAWLRVITVMVGVAPTTQNIVFGVMALIAVMLTTDRAKIGIVK